MTMHSFLSDMYRLTYRVAKRLLDIGDAVFTVEGGQVIEHKVERIYADCIKVQDGYLYFDEIRETWWLTKKVAAASIGKVNKIVSYI